MIAFKFLGPGAVGPFSHFAWPPPLNGAPGPWIEAEISRDRGIHACRPGDLPYWIDAELWRAELAGPIEEAPLQVVAPHGRLLGRVEGWDPATAARFAEDCALRLRGRAVAHLDASGLPGPSAELAAAADLPALASLAPRLAAPLRGTTADLVGYVGDAASAGLAGKAAVASYIAAHAADRCGGGPRGFTDERAEQARWLVRTLAL